MNVTTMICRLTKDAEIKYSQGAEPMAITRFSVACDRDYKKKDEQSADFYNCIAFGKLAETISKYAGAKGAQVGLEGRFQNNNWTDRDGKKHYDYQFVVNKLTFCGGSKNEAQQNNADAPKVPESTSGADFMNIPDGIEDSLPFE